MEVALLAMQPGFVARFIRYAARVFYSPVVGQRIVILHHFVKKSLKTPPKEIAIARRRLAEWTR